MLFDDIRSFFSDSNAAAITSPICRVKRGSLVSQVRQIHKEFDGAFGLDLPRNFWKRRLGVTMEGARLAPVGPGSPN